MIFKMLLIKVCTFCTQYLKFAVSIDMLHESFESNPDFSFPIGGYHLDLCNQPSDGHLLQEFVDLLRKQLKKAQSE